MWKWKLPSWWVHWNIFWFILLIPIAVTVGKMTCVVLNISICKPSYYRLLNGLAFASFMQQQSVLENTFLHHVECWHISYTHGVVAPRSAYSTHPEHFCAIHYVQPTHPHVEYTYACGAPYRIPTMVCYWVASFSVWPMLDHTNPAPRASDRTRVQRISPQPTTCFWFSVMIYLIRENISAVCTYCHESSPVHTHARLPEASWVTRNILPAAYTILNPVFGHVPSWRCLYLIRDVFFFFGQCMRPEIFLRIPSSLCANMCPINTVRSNIIILTFSGSAKRISILSEIPRFIINFSYDSLGL